MQKTQAIAVMGQRSLLMPGWIKAALQANDHPKLYLSVLQAAAAHAEHPESEVLDLTAELASAHVDTLWLRDMPASASLVDDTLLVPELAVLAQHLTEDLQTMARPLLESETKPDADTDALRARTHHWLDWLAALRGERIRGMTGIHKKSATSLSKALI
jgi:hypothetical protein